MPPAQPTAWAQAAPKYTAKIGHLESPPQPRHRGLEKVSALVKERTKGEVEFKLFPASQLGNARQMIEGTQFGSLECNVMPAAFLGGFNPVVSIFDIPFLLPDDRRNPTSCAPARSANTSSIPSRRAGLVAIALWPNGRKSLTSNKPLNKIEAFKGQKFRVMDSRILIEQFSAVGANAIAIAFGELYTALQTGVVDGEENPLDTISTMKFHEVQKYLVVSNHGAMEDVVLFNPAWWNGLPEGHRKIITETFIEVRPEVEAMKKEATGQGARADQGLGQGRDADDERGGAQAVRRGDGPEAAGGLPPARRRAKARRRSSSTRPSASAWASRPEPPSPRRRRPRCASNG